MDLKLIEQGRSALYQTSIGNPLEGVKGRRPAVAGWRCRILDMGGGAEGERQPDGAIQHTHRVDDGGLGAAREAVPVQASANERSRATTRPPVSFGRLRWC